MIGCVFLIKEQLSDRHQMNRITSSENAVVFSNRIYYNKIIKKQEVKICQIISEKKCQSWASA